MTESSVKRPTSARGRRSLWGPKSPSRARGGATVVVHFSPLYFRPFFTYGMSVVEQAGWVVSTVQCVASRMTKDFGEGCSDRKECFAAVYFIAQAIPPLFLTALPDAPLVQRVNQLPRIEMICDKVSMALLLNRLRRENPKRWGFYPTTCTSRSEFEEAKAALPDSTWVVKHDHMCGGSGVEVVREVDQEVFAKDCLVQLYTEPPLLIEKKRFDVRVYVLVTQVDPLCVYAGREGVIHLCTKPYKPPRQHGIGSASSHITNYAVNSKEEGYRKANASGSHGNNRGYAVLQSVLGDLDAFWKKVHTVIMQTLTSVVPFVHQGLEQAGKAPGRCFQVLGYDFGVLEDESPVLFEVNQFPSWIADDAFFMNVKRRLLKGVIELVDLSQGPATMGGAAELGTDDARFPQEDSGAFFQRIWPACSPSRVDEAEVEASLREAQSTFPSPHPFDPSATVKSRDLLALLAPAPPSPSPSPPLLSSAPSSTPPSPPAPSTPSPRPVVRWMEGLPEYLKEGGGAVWL